MEGYDALDSEWGLGFGLSQHLERHQVEGSRRRTFKNEIKTRQGPFEALHAGPGPSSRRHEQRRPSPQCDQRRPVSHRDEPPTWRWERWRRGRRFSPALGFRRTLHQGPRVGTGTQTGRRAFSRNQITMRGPEKSQYSVGVEDSATWWKCGSEGYRNNKAQSVILRRPEQRKTDDVVSLK